MTKAILLLSLILVSVINFVTADDYMAEMEGHCKQKRDVLSCGKYTMLRYIDQTTADIVVVTNSTSPVKLVKIQADKNEPSIFAEGRALATDSEFTKLVSFMKKRMDRFLRTQGISIPLPSGFRVVEEGENNAVEPRGPHSKKKNGIISLLTLLGVFKLKLLIGLVLLGLFFIKKVILLSALILPSILHNLKMSCKHIFPAHHVSSHHGEEYHDDSIYGNYGNSGYSKDWERRYRQAAQSGMAATQDFAG